MSFINFMELFYIPIFLSKKKIPFQAKARREIGSYKSEIKDVLDTINWQVVVDIVIGLESLRGKMEPDSQRFEIRVIC